MTRRTSFFSFREPVCFFGIPREYAFPIFHNKRAATAKSVHYSIYENSGAVKGLMSSERRSDAVINSFA